MNPARFSVTDDWRHCPVCGIFSSPRHRCPGYGWCLECDSMHDLRGPCRHRLDGWIVSILVAAVLVVIGVLIGRWL